MPYQFNLLTFSPSLPSNSSFQSLPLKLTNDHKHESHHFCPIQDIKLQSEAGQTHLLRISSRDDGPTIFSSLKVEYDLHQWLSSLGLGTTLPFDRPIGSSWSEGEGEAAMGDGLTWSLYQVRASNASIGYGWESLKDDQKVS